MRISKYSSAPHATESDVAGGGVDRLGIARGRTVALAVVLGAEVRAALEHFPWETRRIAPVDTAAARAAARIGRHAAGTALVALELGLGEPVGGPLPDIGDHVVEAVA